MTVILLRGVGQPFSVRIRGHFLQSGPNKRNGLNWRMALICGRNRGVLITEFKKETDRGLLFGLNGRVALIERILLEGFYCIFF